MRPSVPDVYITDPQDEESVRVPGGGRPGRGGAADRAVVPAGSHYPDALGRARAGDAAERLALRRIRRSEPGLTGRKMALAGLLLSLAFLAAAPTDWFAYRWRVRREAAEFAGSWLHFLTTDEPQKAFQLTLPPAGRQPLDDRLWAVYRDTPKLRQGLENYVKVPLVRTLLALGPKARVRFFDTAGQTSGDREDVVELIYAVSYEEQGEQKSFLVAVQMVRSHWPTAPPAGASPRPAAASGRKAGKVLPDGQSLQPPAFPSCRALPADAPLALLPELDRRCCGRPRRAPSGPFRRPQGLALDRRGRVLPHSSRRPSLVAGYARGKRLSLRRRMHREQRRGFAPKLNRRPYHDNIMAKYGSIGRWAGVGRDRLRDWGFTTLGTWSSEELQGRFPYTVNLKLSGRLWDAGIPNVFAESFRQHVAQQARQAAQHAHDPWRPGYCLDNDVPWLPDWRLFSSVFQGYLAMPADSPGKRKFVEFFRGRYQTTGRLAQVWDIAVKDWSWSLAAALAMTPGDADRARQDRDDFTLLVVRGSTSKRRRRQSGATTPITCCWAAASSGGRRRRRWSGPAARPVDVVSVNFYEIGPGRGGPGDACPRR